MKQKVLLHCCCAPCSSAIIEWMLNNDVEPVLYYYNPNIYPEEEYLIRKNELTRYAEKLGLIVIDGDWEHERWLEEVGRGRENEPERGSRCMECFRMRMLAAAKKCKELNLSEFTTTLASSRWKNLTQINEAGKWAAEQEGVTFNDRNWRKGGLQDRRNALLKENNFYNQQYCGCEYSFRKQDKE